MLSTPLFLWQQDPEIKMSAVSAMPSGGSSTAVEMTTDVNSTVEKLQELGEAEEELVNKLSFTPYTFLNTLQLFS